MRGRDLFIINRGKENNRNSSIELIKIIAIFLIVINHVIQTIGTENSFIFYHDYVINLNVATTNIQQLILSILRYSGTIGNTIFFACSAWFMIDSKKFNVKKWFHLLFEVWVISIVILAITYINRSGNIDVGIIIKSMLPTTFENNWYITCYLLFYLAHILLNKIIHEISQIQLLRISAALIIIYIGINFVINGLFFCTDLILWIVIYFIISYIKIYCQNFVKNKKINIFLLCFGIIAHISIIIFTNFIGLRIHFFSNWLLRWNNASNPFIIFSVIALINLLHATKFHSNFINNFSKLSLLIYIIHENIIIRTYYRPYFINYIYENYGYKYILLWVILLSIAIFIISAIISHVYDLTLRKYVNRLCLLVYKIFSTQWKKVEKFLIKLD